ncbi:MAG: DUF2959 domain-containing protein [Planctomycetes bacterium]|nr:DUF2959 domain-containing protein [Planctomycetota bacterium]
MKKHILLLTLFLLTNAGCQDVYYNTMEGFGVHKRDILVDRVEDARDAQEQTKEQFASALEKFTEVANFKGGDLEAKYKQLKHEFDVSTSKAKTMRSRIDKVEDVAEALFEEWSEELEQYSSQRLKLASEKKMTQTRRDYDGLMAAMRKAETKVDPVLTAFSDHVLFLKHNLNAAAISSLQQELGAIESDIASLIAEMNSSIAEADAFIKQMSSDTL